MAKLPKYQSGGRVSAPSFNMSPYIQSDIYTDMLKTQDEYKNLFKRQEDMDRENEESRPEQGYSAAGAPSPAATGGGATGGGGGTTGGGGGGY